MSVTNWVKLPRDISYIIYVINEFNHLNKSIKIQSKVMIGEGQSEGQVVEWVDEYNATCGPQKTY